MTLGCAVAHALVSAKSWICEASGPSTLVRERARAQKRVMRVPGARSEPVSFSAEPGQRECKERAADPGSFGEVVRRLSLRHPTTSVALISGLLAAALDETDDARVQGFRLVLAERRVRNVLRMEPVTGLDARQEHVA